MAAASQIRTSHSDVLEQHEATSRRLLRVGVIPDGTRRWAARNGVSLSKAYDATMTSIVSAVKELIHVADTREIVIYFLSRRNLQRRVSDLVPVLRAETKLAEGGLRQLACDAGLRILPVGLENVRLSTKSKYVRGVVDRYIAAWTALAHATDIARTRSLYALVGYDPMTELDLVLTKPLASRFSISSLSVPVLLDLVIRTGGDRRLSGFVPLQCAEAEIVVLNKSITELKRTDIRMAIDNFHSRERRFGR